MFQRETDIHVVGEAVNGEEAVEKARACQPDVILLDLALPKKGGLDIIKELLSLRAESKILIFTAFSEGEKVFAAIKAGAIGYLVKDCSPQELLTAVRNAYLGKPVLSIPVERSLFNQIQNNLPSDQTVEALTERELEILHWLALGLTNAEISGKAFISEGTVRSHISHLLNKLALKNRAQAVIYAVRNGLVDLDQAG